MHIDLNAFFARAEELRHPEYEGKPLIVGGLRGRGVVSTCSYEARKYGVHSAMPIFQARKLCPGGIYVEPDFEYYSVMSESFIEYIRRYSKIIEQVSIDEAFVDMTESLKNVKDKRQYLLNIQNGLLKEIGLKCSIGIASTKWLAKMGSDLKKPMGLTIIRRSDMPKVIYPLSIDAFWGIGKKSAPHLKEMGINTIGDLAKHVRDKDEKLEKFFGKFYERISEWVMGKGSDFVNPIPEEPKSIGHSETFLSDTDDAEEIIDKIKELSSRVSSRAKYHKKAGKTIQLQIKDSEFKSHDKSITLAESTDKYEVIAKTAINLYEKYFEGVMVRLVGVTLQNLVDPREEIVQMTLWNVDYYEEMDKTKLLINEFNRQLKNGKLIRASEMKKEKKDNE